MIVHRRLRYRIYPTAEQAVRLDAWSCSLRFLWNLAHEQRLLSVKRPRGYRRYFSAYDQMRDLTDLRAELPWLKDVPRNVAAHLLVELDLAWKQCFRGTASEPHWKLKERDVPSLTEPHYKLWWIDDEGLHFPKLSPLRITLHRPLVGKPKTCTISRDVDQWFATVVCEIEVADPLPSVLPPIGIDRGCVNLIADSNGRVVENPRHLQSTQHRLARAQRSTSRKKKGSKNQKKCRIHIAKIHRKVRRQRDHVLHCESKLYAENQGMIFIEHLQIGNMSAHGGARKRGLNRSILNAGWGRFADMCRYKTAPLGGHVHEVPAPNTSLECSICGCIDARNRQTQSVFLCVSCGHREHADTNAAKNILKRGLAVEPTVTACRGLAEVRHPAKQERRTARRGTRRLSR